VALDPLASESNPTIYETGLTREVYTLLAQANLLRIRGCWEESVESCMAALRLAPESSSAQSLLGDIYENQGRYDDAAQWYRMALDVNPNSPADRLKLDLLQRLRLDPQTNDIASPDLPNSGGLVKFVRNPEAALRLSSAAAVFLLLLVIGLAYVSSHRHGSSEAFGLPRPPDVQLQPVVVSPEPAASAPLPSAPHDPAEQSLLDSLRNSAELKAQGIVVIDVASDPRTSQIGLTFGLTAPPEGVTRAYVQQMAVRLLQSAVSIPSAQSANSFQVRCLILNESSSPEATLVFIGDAAHSSVPTADNVLSSGHLDALFGTPWWSSSVPN
jgi:hypothetical protein